MRQFFAGFLFIAGVVGLIYLATKVIALEGLALAIYIGSAICLLLAGIMAGSSAGAAQVKEMQQKLQDMQTRIQEAVCNGVDEYKRQEAARAENEATVE